METAIFRAGGFIVPAFALVVSLPLLFLTSAFFQNFNFHHWTHLVVFCVTVLGPSLAILSAVLFQLRPRRWTYLATVSSLVIVLATWGLWVAALPSSLIL